MPHQRAVASADTLFAGVASDKKKGARLSRLQIAFAQIQGGFEGAVPALLVIRGNPNVDLSAVARSGSTC